MANETARSLRKQMTPQEVKLWVHLRSWRKQGFHFRRQAPREDYIVDFVCLKHRLVVEVDGGQHNFDMHAQRDAERDRHLSDKGFRVLRFWNNDIDRNLDGVLTVINEALREPPPGLATLGHPPPSGEGFRSPHRTRMDPAGFFRRIPLLPHQMEARTTAAADMIVLCHLGVPRLDAAQWSIAIDGLVERPMRLSFSELTAYPRHTVTSFHQCAGSPLAPLEPTQRICNVHWAGTRLADVLRDASPARGAKYVWSRGADHGSFGGLEHDAYVKDLPIARVASDVLIAYELNGAPLPAEHGYPARLVVPGFYGTNSVKWLARITLADRRAEGAFTTRWYNDPSGDGAGTVPVWSVAPQSVIVAPAPGGVSRRNTALEIWGWAWADDGVARVDISADGSESWSAAALEPREDRSWQRFAMSWRPAASGPITLCSRATSVGGATQPGSGARNAIYRVEITIE